VQEIKFLVIHHSASPRSTTAATIRKWHKRRGFKDIGYSYVIEEDGKLVVGRGLRQSLAANPPHNGDSIAVCVTGDNTRPEHRWNGPQWDTLNDFVSAIELLFPKIKIGGHRDIGSTPTECPGLSVKDAFPR